MSDFYLEISELEFILRFTLQIDPQTSVCNPFSQRSNTELHKMNVNPEPVILFDEFTFTNIIVRTFQDAMASAFFIVSSPRGRNVHRLQY